MAQADAREVLSTRQEAQNWLVTQLRWEDRFAELRRPGGGRPTTSRRHRPPAPVRRAS